ncbi:hypothetical protein ACWDRB_51295 [Nonomuraea sp. NPDC003707]
MSAESRSAGTVTADLGRTHDDTEALLQSRSLDEDYWRKPLGELGLL